MDFHLTEEERALKQEYDDFFREEMKNAPPVILKGGLAAQYSKEGYPFNRYMRKKMVEKGWYVQHWPKEYGGRDASLMEQMIFNESMAYYGAPGIDLQAVKMFGPSLLLYGTEEQKKRLVIPIAKGEAVCPGLDRTERRVGSGLLKNNGHQGWGVLCGQRAENMDHCGPYRRSYVSAGPYQSG